MPIAPLLAQAADGTPNDPTGSDAPATAAEKLMSLDFGAISPEEWMELARVSAVGAVITLLGLFAAWTISAWLAGMVGSALRRVKFDETLTKFISKFVRWSILLLVFLACLSTFGVQTTSFAAVIGAAGLAIGLAFQGTLSNFAAGAMLLVFRPYKVGDVVNVAGYLGKVYEIELFTTAIDTFDNRRIIVPNSSIYGAVIENITYHPVRRVDVEVGTAYDADLNATREALMAAVGDVPGFVAEPEGNVVLKGLGGSSVDWLVQGWSPGDDFLGNKQALLQAVKERLDGAGIGIPFPQMDVHLDGQAAA